ncbi:dihydroxy-acid dehydratase [Candidatus Pelagisphaera phototrophica]|uniref:dihydroxy-acid dehydratase n=1 Tax=Candidatus Pelagisphaera phototrophica TaxID=2684113 RepID=UPI0024B6FC82|nr:dihydroxy-acid dehydratase [Candidatus Pelagisphaera phototrophica]QXD33723.1 dihydroxy-acid dehydratase [Candidatus Pelagisphaera phototrophica]
MTTENQNCNRPHSSVVVDGNDRAPARSMLRAVGFGDDDFKKPQIAIASTGSDLTPCNMHIDELATHATKGANEAGGKAVNFSTITISDGISMGTKGMRYSLVSREVIADSIETVVAGEGMDGLVAIGGCDKNMPGCMMAIARLNRPSVFVYGGSILPGIHKGQPTDIVSIFEAVGRHARGEIDDAELKEIESTCIPGPGSCGGMYTANSMASAIEVLGMSLPGSSAQLAVSEDKRIDCENAGRAVFHLIDQNLRPSDILTKKSFENAITTCITLGGSTNIILHLLAIAHSADVELSIDDFERLGEKVPLLADVKPFGKYNMSHLIRIGGIQPMMKILLDRGLLHGDCLTVTGKTIAENLQEVGPYPAYPNEQDIIRPWDQPIKETSHLRVLKGNLAPSGAVGKITGKEGLYFKGTAKVYENEEDSLQGILRGDVVAGDVVVIRNEGPAGGPGMREMLSPTSAVAGRGLIKEVALITDGRFSGGSHGFDVGHITPEAACGGPIGIVQNGDEIEIDATRNTISLNIPEDVYNVRMDAYQPAGAGEKRGVLGKYAKLVASASEGAVTDKYL